MLAREFVACTMVNVLRGALSQRAREAPAFVWLPAYGLASVQAPGRLAGPRCPRRDRAGVFLPARGDAPAAFGYVSKLRTLKMVVVVVVPFIYTKLRRLPSNTERERERRGTHRDMRTHTHNCR